LEILHILSVEQHYNIELLMTDFDNFNFFGGKTFATASQLQEFLFDKVIEHTLIRSREDDRNRHHTYSRVYLINQYVKALRKCVPDVEVDQFSPRQRSLYIFYGKGQMRPAHHTHMAQLIIINYYILYCKRNNLPVGDRSEFQEFTMEFFGAPPYRPSSAPPLTVFTLNTHLINEARGHGAETPEHEEYCKQFRDQHIALALEKHNVAYLKNQRRSPVETRFSNSYYIYSQPATPDEVPGKHKTTATPDEVSGKRKKARLCGRLPGTSVKPTKNPTSKPSESAPQAQQSSTSHRRHKRKKNKYDRLYEQTFQDALRGRPISSSTPSSVDTVRPDNNTRRRSEPGEPVSVSSTIPVAIPITHDDPIVTPTERRRSARIESQNISGSLTRSESERRWRVFTRGITQSEETRAWREHVREFYAEQAAKLKMAEEHAKEEAKAAIRSVAVETDGEPTLRPDNNTRSRSTPGEPTLRQDNNTRSRSTPGEPVLTQDNNTTQRYWRRRRPGEPILGPTFRSTTPPVSDTHNDPIINPISSTLRRKSTRIQFRTVAQFSTKSRAE
jgi:hypothetical protein